MAGSPQRSVASVEEEDDVCSTAAVAGGRATEFAIPLTLKDRCMRVLRWDSDFTTRAIRGYRQFMELKIRLGDFDATKLASPPIIEQVWQQHILDVNHYAEAAQGGGDGSGGELDQARGGGGGGGGRPRRIHHDPDDGFWNATHASRVRATELAVEGSPEKVDPEIWSFAQSGNANNDDDEEEERSSKRRRRHGSFTSTTTRSSPGPRRTDAITFFVRWAQNNNHHRPNDLYFKIRPDTKMARVFERFNMHWNQNDESDEEFTFFFGGKMVRPIDTANTLGLVSDDMINATRCKAVLDSD